MKQEYDYECNFCHEVYMLNEGIFMHDKYFVCEYCFNVMELLLGIGQGNFGLLKEAKEVLIDAKIDEKTDSELFKEQQKENACEVDRTEKELYPQSIRDFIDNYVISQDSAKKTISTAVYNHYIRQANPDTELPKTNIMLIGPSGTGKTHIIKTIARLIDAPLYIADGPAYTQTGWRGLDVTEMLSSLIMSAEGDIDKAERGIIVIDESDKLAQRAGVNKDSEINGKGVQQSLLKMLEGSLVTVNMGHNKEIQVDTSNILFILIGVFPGLQDIINERMRGSVETGIGFGRESSKSKKGTRHDVISEDLIKYGFLAEFIGRVPVVATLDDLSKKDLVKILKEPKDSILKRYETLFKLSGIDLTFKPSTIEYIANEAIRRGVGARGLATIVENLMKDKMYELPGSDVKEYTVKPPKKNKKESQA